MMGERRKRVILSPDILEIPKRASPTPPPVHLGCRGGHAGGFGDTLGVFLPHCLGYRAMVPIGGVWRD
jgi:hypothetical protein